MLRALLVSTLATLWLVLPGEAWAQRVLLVKPPAAHPVAGRKIKLAPSKAL